MTTILPSARSPLDAIFELTGRSLQQTLPQAAQQAGQRQQGLNAIDQLQRDIEAAGGDPLKALPALMKAYTLNPPLERSGIAEKALTLGQRQRGTEDFKVGEGKTTKSGVPLQGEEGQEKPVSVSDLVAPKSYVSDPQGLKDFHLPYGPEDIANIRNQARARNYTPDAEERFVKDALELNEIAKQRRNVDLQNYQQQETQRQDTLKNQIAFEDYLRTHVPEVSKNPDELQLALQESQKHQDKQSFSERANAVKNFVRPYQAAKNSLQKALERPLFGMTEQQIAALRPRAQKMIEMGQKDQLRLMIANAGQGEAEEAYLLNPLPSNVEKTLKVGTTDFIDPYSDKIKDTETAKKKLADQENRMINYLSENMNSGTYEKPGTNLLLVRKHLMDHKLNSAQSQRIIDQAIQKSGVKLDPHQEIDYQRLAYPPLTGEDFFDTVLNNFLFPITGKQ